MHGGRQGHASSSWRRPALLKAPGYWLHRPETPADAPCHSILQACGSPVAACSRPAAARAACRLAARQPPACLSKIPAARSIDFAIAFRACSSALASRAHSLAARRTKPSPRRRHPNMCAVLQPSTILVTLVRHTPDTPSSAPPCPSSAQPSVQWHTPARAASADPRLLPTRLPPRLPGPAHRSFAAVPASYPRATHIGSRMSGKLPIGTTIASNPRRPRD